MDNWPHTWHIAHFIFLLYIFQETKNIVWKGNLTIFLEVCTMCYYVSNWKGEWVFIFRFFRLFYVFFACVYAYAPHVYLVSTGQKRVLDALELELQIAVDHHMGAGNKCS